MLADEDALTQVFGNLIENAVKYGKDGERVLIGARDREDSVEFFVQDFGPGISSEHVDRIFERFYRVDKARSHDSGGTGLGLAIAKHIVMAHGGSSASKANSAPAQPSSSLCHPRPSTRAKCLLIQGSCGLQPSPPPTPRFPVDGAPFTSERRIDCTPPG